MKHIRSIGTLLALSCAVATGSAWAAQGASATDISRQVATDLYKNVGVGPYGIQVHVTTTGVVRLTGSVGTERDWRTAQREARNTDGVAGVQNDLSVLMR
jgi:osmotically-inducible protein OsmY